MGASPSPTVANIFQNYDETKCLAEYPDDFTLQFYRRNLDNKFLIFKNVHQT